MDFPKLLGLRPGVTAVIGSGGKTNLLRRLAEERTRQQEELERMAMQLADSVNA